VAGRPAIRGVKYRKHVPDSERFGTHPGETSQLRILSSVAFKMPKYQNFLIYFAYFFYQRYMYNKKCRSVFKEKLFISHNTIEINNVIYFFLVD
jgi:hypothetical protein